MGPSRTSAVSGLLRKKGQGCPSRFAVPPASPPDSSTLTRPPRPPCAPASTSSFSLKIERGSGGEWLTGFGPASRVAPSTKSSCSQSLVSRRDANVVRWTVICAHVVPWTFVDIRLWVRSIPCRPRRHPRFFFIENQAEVHDVWIMVSGCPVHEKQLLPVLVVWAPPRKKRNEEQHALNGSTSASAASSSCGTILGTGSKRHSFSWFCRCVAQPPWTPGLA